jgi:5-(carboxyamino)imidazole ribonucleotide synthase
MNASTSPILPGATLGVLGSGQLGRMFAIAARYMGYRVATFSPDRNSPTGQIADLEVVAPYDDLDAVRDFARRVDVVTFEFENVLTETAEAIAGIVPVRPSGHVLHTTQNRLREKTFLANAGIPCTPFRAIDSREALAEALNAFGYPSILKTAGFGYDGKGQWRIKSAEEADAAWGALAGSPGVLEAFVSFEREVSVVGARGVDGEFVHYGAVDNSHANHILDITSAPSTLAPEIARQAEEITRAAFEALDVVGVLCVEFFITTDGRVLVNELAPRPHNSGHWTIEGCVTSQFEQQVRAICGLPLGSVQRVAPGVAMANLLGDVWPEQGEPDWAAALRIPGAKLHLYGKAQARPGRKMGHITALGATPEEAAATVKAARAAL